MLTWCATGHRPDKLGGYGHTGLPSDALRDLAKWYFTLHRPEHFISGMAQGWDQACAWACHDLGIPFTAAVPCVGQESKWPERAQVWYRRLLGMADRVHIVSTSYSAKAMQLRNEWMVDHSQGVIALWDGSAGGTSNCVRYAEAKGVPLVNLWPWWRD